MIYNPKHGLFLLLSVHSVFLQIYDLMKTISNIYHHMYHGIIGMRRNVCTHTCGNEIVL